MNKIINILLMGIVGILGSVFAILIWVLGVIFLIFNEIPGAKNFRVRLHKLNVIIKEEFGDIFQIFRKLGRAK